MDKSIYSKRQARLCQLLRASRKTAGLTQKELAQRLRAYTSYVSKYEKGERRIDVIEFMAITESLGVDPAKLLRKLRLG